MAGQNVTIRVDDDLKRDADALFSQLGMTFSGAVNVFLRQCVREGGLPFVPTTRRTAAMQSRVEYTCVNLSDNPAEE